MILCTYEGCGDQAQKRGWCEMHYQRWRRHGDPSVNLQPHGLTLRERFDRFVVVREGCWGWAGKIDGDGYAALFVDGQWVHASRVSWRLHRGPIPPAVHVLHHCDDGVCTRPDCLFLGSNADNVKDKVTKGRQYRLYPAECSVAGCPGKSRKLGLCYQHYNRQYHQQRRALHG